MEEKCRCSWAGDVPVYVDYHDNEWEGPPMTIACCSSCWFWRARRRASRG